MTVAAAALLLIYAEALTAVEVPATASPSPNLVGQRPYEMVWARRTRDDHPPLIDFDNLDGWKVENHNAQATWELSRQEQLWGRFVGKLTYRGSGPAPRVTLRPPRPLPITGPFDCVNFWVYGNNWSWESVHGTPRVTITVILRGSRGTPVRVVMGTVNWKEWFVMHHRLAAEQLAGLVDGAALEAIEVSGGQNADDRVLYFDNLSVYKEVLRPLSFEPRPLRGITPLDGQSIGANTGPGRLAFPTREETILPDNLTRGGFVTLETVAAPPQQPAGPPCYVFHYRGADGELTARYRPLSGTLGDVQVQWGDRRSLRPLDGGGLYFVGPSENAPPVAAEKIQHLDCRKDADSVTSTWRATVGGRTIDYRLALRLWQKSLVIDTWCIAGTGDGQAPAVAEFRVGRALGAEEPRLVTLPYLTCDAHRPAVLVMGPAEKPLFLTAFVDHCRSNASALFAVNDISADGVTYNGGSRYLPKTDGRRNACCERLFLTVSPRFEEVLPNVPNPQSPWMCETGQRVWRAHGASRRDSDYAFWKLVARYGMTKTLVTDHETGWRDGGESFTLRTKAAPGRGGDAGQADYAHKMHALGLRYGIYNNYTDFAPVNEFWNEDYVTRFSNGDWRPAWARCYNLKPSRAVELEARLAPIIQRKFHLDTAYCDVHTAVTPWGYVDFDGRVPGAGTFAATFYAYGELMLHQKRTWNGPVYSEGNNHWYYCGLTDGNYGQDQAARLPENPWLVDFDLRKLHPLCCNFGMGNLGMFYGKDGSPGSTPQEQQRRMYRFLAATLAFGHTGFLVTEGGMPNAVRSYYSVQQVHSRYAQERVVDIRYADAAGRMLDSSAAVATGTFRRSQIATRYGNGLEVLVNGNPDVDWTLTGAAKGDTLTLPPNGWLVRAPRGLCLSAYSMLVDGHRADYVDGPDYTYADGRGTFTRFPKMACDHQLVALPRGDHRLEVIPVGGTQSMAVSCGGRDATAQALDEAGKVLGLAETRLARGLVHIMPVSGAFSYLLEPNNVPPAEVSCSRDRLVPGETIAIGRPGETFSAATDARPGARLWRKLGKAWLDFTVVPLVAARLELKAGLLLELTPNVSQAAEAEVTLAGQSRHIRLVPGELLQLAFPLPSGDCEEVRPLALHVAAGPLAYDYTWWLKRERSVVPVATLPESFQSGQGLRRKGETSSGDERPLNSASGAQVARRESSCGGVTQPSIFMHPPYKSGVGYSWASFGPIELPSVPAAFRCEIGKADGSDPGDGILFQIAVVDTAGITTIVARQQWIRHAWTPLEADLSPWTGKTIRLKLIADVGPGNNSSGDWACWAKPRIESLKPMLQTTLHETAVQSGHQVKTAAP